MSNKILVTDTLFIFDEHVKQLEAAGYEVVRLSNPKAGEEELCEAVKGKVGYILGGVEKVTDKVIEAADELKALVFTGTSWAYFIEGHELATEKGIALANAPHANANAVADWTFTAGMAMIRNLFALGRTGDKTFQTVRDISELQVGIIGLGHVGARVADMFTGVGAKRIVYWSQSEKQSAYERLELDEVIKTSDIVVCAVSGDVGKNWFGEKKLALVKDGALITCLADEALDETSLLKHLKAGRLKAYIDWMPADDAYEQLPLDIFYCSNESAAYNTQAANKMASDWATTSMINLLTTSQDQYKVN